eukprot:1063948-Pelagomonas_calceolata.AAC.1
MCSYAHSIAASAVASTNMKALAWLLPFAGQLPPVEVPENAEGQDAFVFDGIPAQEHVCKPTCVDPAVAACFVKDVFCRPCSHH